VAELIALSPDVILVGGGTAAVAAVQLATRTVPIVFTVILDPAGRVRIRNIMPIARDYSRASQSFYLRTTPVAYHGLMD
jgi:hypothetical protein